jgi:hypothetical protein
MYICDMPSIQHEGLVELVRQHPPLGVELLRHVGTFALPAEVTAVLGSEDMSDVTPRSNGRPTGKPKPQTYTADSVVIVADAVSGERLIAVVIEPQGRASDDKNQSWPVYATTARKANKCPRAVLVVACWDPAEAEGCRRIIATGHPGLVFVPIVIDRASAPPLADASPYLVLFNAVIGAVDLDTEEGRAHVVAAITATGAEGARFRSLCDIILGIASDAAHEHLEGLMGITYKSKFVDGWYQQGCAVGEAKGKAEGIAEGEARGAARTRAEDILCILKSRGLEPTRAERELIESSDDLARLHTWFNRALTAATVAMVFEDLSELPVSGITYKSKFVDRWYQAGYAAGEAEGRARGLSKGQARGSVRTILRVLKSRGLPPTRAQRKLIESCDDLTQLDTWLERAITVATVAMLFED